MKNKLLPLVFVLGCYSAYSQVGIGTNVPRSGAQLDVTAAAKNKGILIPDVELTGTTDNTTIKNKLGETTPESLLVYNTKTISDVTPGYYYWFDNKWNRMVNAADLAAATAGAGGGMTGITGATGAPGTR
ncbi:hypothetical protein [Flavobacterium sp. ov086]|uniref:hypothetical protein n=1 Tax=Flavobacterium sp. ov086 TaxID=1761785 RepID=UPI000B6929AF|nr:hypothetical protein [Flavobacterium sp. ov086]SNR44883.1 hypothetical protein SAMN04487979_10681 [Flavobacterium sp. ov086]